MNKLIWLMLLASVLTITSCNKKLKVFSSDDAEVEEFSTESFQFEYLQAKSKVRYQSPDQSISSTANIRMKKDSLIWISLAPALGIELARGIISQDTVIFLDRINKEVYAYNYEQLGRMLNFPVDFDKIQSLLLGDLPLPRETQDELLKTNADFLLTQQRANLKIINQVQRENRKLQSITMIEQPSGNNMTVEFDDFRLIEKDVFPFLGIISIIYKSNQGDEETNVRIEHSRVERLQSPLSFPFSIPDKYYQP